MPVSNQTSVYPYAITSLGQTLAFPNYFVNATDLTVVDRNPTTGVDTVLILGTDYTVTGAGNPAGGSVVLEGTGLHYAIGDQVTVYRNTVLTQPTNYQDGTPYPAAVQNVTVDWIVMQIQALYSRFQRCLRMPVSDSDPGSFSLASRKGMLVGFDVYGNLTLVTNPGSVAASGFLWQQAITGFTGGGATNLDGLNAALMSAGAVIAFVNTQQKAGFVVFQLTVSGAAPNGSSVIAALNQPTMRWIQQN